jgi:hypothetical protein
MVNPLALASVIVARRRSNGSTRRDCWTGIPEAKLNAAHVRYSLADATDRAFRPAGVLDRSEPIWFLGAATKLTKQIVNIR